MPAADSSGVRRGCAWSRQQWGEEGVCDVFRKARGAHWVQASSFKKQNLWRMLPLSKKDNYDHNYQSIFMWRKCILLLLPLIIITNISRTPFLTRTHSALQLFT